MLKRLRKEWRWQLVTLAENGFYDQTVLPWTVGIVTLAMIEFIAWIYAPLEGAVKQSFGTIMLGLWVLFVILATIDMCREEIMILNRERKIRDTNR